MDGAPAKHVRAGWLTITPDQMPVIGPSPTVAGVVYAMGMNGFGNMWAPGTGLALAELIVDGHATTVDIAAFSAARFANMKR